MQKLYPENNYQYFDEINTKIAPKIEKNSPAQMQSIERLIQPVQQKWGKTEFNTIHVKNPNTQQAQITFIERKDHSITRNQAQMTFNAITGQPLSSSKNESAIATLNAGVYGLHMATFAQPLLRLALLFSGLLGCAMIASGLLLWSLKRQLQNKQQQFHFGHYLVQRLNITAILGLPIAVMSYFYANRIGLSLHSSQNYEVITFFSVWLAVFILSLCLKKQYLWKVQLSIFITLAFSLVVFNLLYLLYLLKQDSIQDFIDYWTFLRIDIFIVLFALLAIFLYKNIHPIQLKAHTKIKNKLDKNAQLKNLDGL